MLAESRFQTPRYVVGHSGRVGKGDRTRRIGGTESRAGRAVVVADVGHQ